MLKTVTLDQEDGPKVNIGYWSGTYFVEYLLEFASTFTLGLIASDIQSFRKIQYNYIQHFTFVNQILNFKCLKL